MRGTGSFESFVNASTPALRGFARALAQDPADAADLVQETFARMGERWGRRPLEDPAAYARTIMVRLNIDRLRQLRRDRDLKHRSQPAEPAPVGSTAVDDTWLIAALATLTPRQRTALALRYVDDLTTEAIASRMGCSPGTARSHLSRGLDRLRNHSPHPTRRMTDQKEVTS